MNQEFNYCKNGKEVGRGSGRGVKVVVNEELKLLRKCTKTFGVRSGEGRGGWSGWW